MFGLTTKRALMREVVKHAEAYRWERDEAQAKASRAERKLASVMDSLADARIYHGVDFATSMSHSVVVRLDLHPALGFTPTDEARRLAERLTTALMGFQRDHRPDMRDVANGRTRL